MHAGKSSTIGQLGNLSSHQWLLIYFYKFPALLRLWFWLSKSQMVNSLGGKGLIFCRNSPSVFFLLCFTSLIVTKEASDARLDPQSLSTNHNIRSPTQTERQRQSRLKTYNILDFERDLGSHRPSGFQIHFSTPLAVTSINAVWWQLLLRKWKSGDGKSTLPSQVTISLCVMFSFSALY